MWLTIVAWRTLAEQVNKIVKKGALVLVSGKLSVRPYTDKQEAKHTALEIIAHSVQVFPATPKPQTQAGEDEADAIATDKDLTLSGTKEKP